jgi:hypothetical protein
MSAAAACEGQSSSGDNSLGISMMSSKINSVMEFGGAMRRNCSPKQRETRAEFLHAAPLLTVTQPIAIMR